MSDGYYVDTSVIIARYKPGDELFDDAENLFSRRGLSFYGSPLTLVELYAVLSRVWHEIDISNQVQKELKTIVTFIVKDCGLHIAPETYATAVEIAGQRARIPLEYSLAYRHAETLKLRALDLIHVCYVSILKAVYGVSTFITGDEEILAKSHIIREVFKINVKHPRDILLEK